jgi:hypothetical protein
MESPITYFDEAKKFYIVTWMCFRLSFIAAVTWGQCDKTFYVRKLRIF